jgi:hypothetical protein
VLEHVLVFDPQGSGGRLRHAAADPVAEHDLRAALGAARRVRRSSVGSPRRARQRLRLRRRVRSHRHAGRPAEAMSTHWWDTDRDPLVPRCCHRAGAAAQPRLRAAVPPPARPAKAWATLDRPLRRASDPRVGAGHVEGEFDAWACPSPTAARCSTRRSTPCGPRCRRGRTHHGDRWSFEGVGQRPRPVQERLPIWVGGSSKPAMRRAASAAMVGCRKVRQRAGWRPGSSSSARTAPPRAATIRSSWVRSRDRSSSARHPGAPVRAGISRDDRRVPAHLRPTSGRPDQVGFVSRSAEELCDQIATFALTSPPS